MSHKETVPQSDSVAEANAYWMGRNGSRQVLEALQGRPETDTVELVYYPQPRVLTGGDSEETKKVFPEVKTTMTVAQVREHMAAIAKGDLDRDAGSSAGHYELSGN